MQYFGIDERRPSQMRIDGEKSTLERIFLMHFFSQKKHAGVNRRGWDVVSLVETGVTFTHGK
jgi:hypothetical protein